MENDVLICLGTEVITVCHPVMSNVERYLSNLDSTKSPYIIIE